MIRSRFLGLHADLARQAPERLVKGREPTRAAIIVLDQLSRNMFRGRPEAFACDGKALTVSRMALDRRYDEELGKPERQFLYIPFMHSEALADQEQSVRLFTSLGDENTLKFAVAHRDIIARFGRFPHRNPILGRDTTPEEAQFMKDHPGF